MYKTNQLHYRKAIISVVEYSQSKTYDHLFNQVQLHFMPRFERPRASTIGTPVYHRRRSEWKDDRDLLEEVASTVNKIDGPYEYYSKGVFAFREKIKSFRAKGYESSNEVFYLGMWLREKINEMSKNQLSYDLRVHPIVFPENLQSAILEMEIQTKDRSELKKEISFESFFPDPELRSFARERTQVLHHGDLNAYLSSLVSKEKDSLMTNSASIMDLIQICEYKFSVLKIEVVKKYTVGETDLWVPSLSLGVEVRNTWTQEDETKLIRTLSDTNFRLRPRHLTVVVSDDLSNQTFDLLRQIEKRKVIENLSIIRIGDFTNYISKILEIEKKKDHS